MHKALKPDNINMRAQFPLSYGLISIFVELMCRITAHITSFNGTGYEICRNIAAGPHTLKKSMISKSKLTIIFL